VLAAQQETWKAYVAAVNDVMGVNHVMGKTGA
jgi:hypothetical protein